MRSRSAFVGAGDATGIAGTLTVFVLAYLMVLEGPIVVDTSLHTKEMTFDQAVDFMVKNANLTPPNAKAEVGRYCSWPTQASSYLTGMLEIIDIRTRWLAKRGSADRAALRAFHDAITSTGSIPTSLAERAIAN